MSATITISVEEYERLKLAFSELEEKKEKEIKKYEALREKDIGEAVREKYKRYYEKHKDEINERRRSARQKKKMEEKEE